MSNSQTPDPATERNLRSTTRTNPRRRQRQSDNDALPAKAPKRRRRNKVEEETFQPRASTENVTQDTQTMRAEEETTTAMNGHIHPTAEKGSTKGTPSLDGTMTIRGRVKRSTRGDNATVLAQNQCYTVKLLPSTPKELRREGAEYRGCLGPHNNALAITHQRALIWEYTAHVPASNPRTFNLPFPSRVGEPLPFGALIANSASATDMGLLLISATSGKVVYYDSIDRATSLGLFQGRKAGVEGQIGLFSGESVVDIISADHAGFVLRLSSGRLAQLTLRDAQGKARIWHQYLRQTDASSSGIFSSFSGMFGGGYKKDMTAVHTRHLNVRGQMQTVALTEKGEVLVWDLDWSGRADFKAIIDFEEVLKGELTRLELPEVEGKAQKFAALDFAILEPSAGSEVATIGAERPLNMAVLLRVGGRDMYNYVLAELELKETTVLVTRIAQVSYESRGDVEAQSKPKLVLPKPSHTIYIVFEDATVLMDAKDPASENPNAQLHGDESFVQPDAYEEAIYLRNGSDLAIHSTFEEEPKGTQSSCVSFVGSAGLIRITAAEVHAQDSWKISPKSRIEQGVFYGYLQPENILDFSRKKDSKVPLNEVASAALMISREIMNAETPYTNFISPSPTSMEQHLAIKAKALRALVAFVRQNYPALTNNIMWQLLWDAERVAAAQQLWIAFEEHVAMVSENGKRKATVLDEVCSWFDKDHNSFVLRPELQDEDVVRKFFIGGLHRMDLLLKNVRTYLRALLNDDDGATPKAVMNLVVQANDIFLRTLETVFAFRTEYCAEYGILPELIDEGILTDSVEYTDVPEFWTAVQSLIDAVSELAGLSRQFATKYYDLGDDLDASTREIAHDNPRLAQLYILQFLEAIRWRLSRPSQKDRDYAEQHQKPELESGRYDFCRSLAEVGQAEAGMKLAEKYRDMNTLTDMVIAEDQFMEEELQSTEHDATVVILQNRNDLQARVRRYFDRYGSLWADAFFDKLFSSASVGHKLEQAQERWAKALKQYLRSNPSRAKICWINDVIKEKDFDHASKVLAQAAHDQENRLWAKKVELSMSKLAALAAQEDGGRSKATKLSNGTGASEVLPELELKLVNIQEKLYDHIVPAVFASLDRQAEIDHCMQEYGKHVSDYPALRQLLENGFNMLLDHAALTVEQLIDILTLMDINKEPSQDDNLQGSEFFMSLQALDAAASMLPTSRFETLLKTIWKRCYIYDDWATEVKLSGKKSDQERKDAIRGTATWATMYQLASSDILSDADTHVRILTPSECLGSGCSPQDLAYRFPNEDLLDPILHDCKIQDELLQSFVSDRYLDEVAEQCRVDAWNFLQNEAEAIALGFSEERQAEKMTNGVNGHGMNGHPRGPNGVAQDGDGDLEME